LLYGTPGGAVEVVTIIFFLYLGDHLRQRICADSAVSLSRNWGLSSLLVCPLGVLVLMNSALPQSNPKGRLAVYYLTQASATPFVVLLSLIATNVAGYTKKSTVSAMYLIGYCVHTSIFNLTLRHWKSHWSTDLPSKGRSPISTC
jgi:ACS family allantoate permease-like MFS transporter